MAYENLNDGSGLGDPRGSAIDQYYGSLARMGYIPQPQTGNTQPGNTPSMPMGIPPAASIGSGVAALGAAAYNYLQMRKRKRRGILDITPQPIKDIAAETGQRARTAKVANFNDRMGQINQGQTGVLNAASKASQTGSQFLQAALSAERIAANQRAALGQEGLQSQSRNRQDNMAARQQVANFQDLARQQYNADIAAYKEAMMRNINTAATSAINAAVGLV